MPSQEGEITVNDQIKHPAIYRHARDYAREHGEISEWRDSYRLNVACKRAIEISVREHFDGMHLDDAALKPVLEQFGAERTAYVLANTIQEKSWDGRFSHSNKAWAAAIPVQTDTVNGENRNYEFAVDSHPAVLDGFVSMFRTAIREQSKDAGMRQTERPSVLEQLKSAKAAEQTAQGISPKKQHEAAR